MDINGEPFIFHQLRWLKSQGASKAVLCVGHMGAAIEKSVGSGRDLGIEVNYSYDGPALLGTAGALKKAQALLSQEFFVLYGDSYLPCPLAPVLAAFRAAAKPALMTVFKNDNRWGASNVEYARGRILKYAKENRAPEMRHIDYGLGVFKKEVLNRVPDESFDLAKLYQQLLGAGELASFEATERFYEIGSPEGLEETRRYLKEHPIGRQP